MALHWKTALPSMSLGDVTGKWRINTKIRAGNLILDPIMCTLRDLWTCLARERWQQEHNKKTYKYGIAFFPLIQEFNPEPISFIDIVLYFKPSVLYVN